MPSPYDRDRGGGEGRGEEGISRHELLARLDGMVPKDEFEKLDSKVNHISEKLAEKSVDYREQFVSLDDRLGMLEKELQAGAVAMTAIATNLGSLQKSWGNFGRVVTGIFVAIGGGVILAILQLPKH